MSSAPPAAPWELESRVPGMAWPAVPDAPGAGTLALLQQLERTQWLAPAALAAAQSAQMAELARHAYDTVPYYRERWGRAPEGALQSLPLLTRGELQANHEALKSRKVPAEHGAVSETSTSGSTGTPVRVAKTALQGLFWRALTLRDHAWRRRDLSGALAVVRRGVGYGQASNWGLATGGLLRTGPLHASDVDRPAGEILDWLRQLAPAYVLTYPSLLREMAAISLRLGVRLEGLREVRAIGESLSDDVRELCRAAWGVPLADFYSCEEAGYLALQCPDHEHYHVMGENVVLEVLREDGSACAPGESGRVVVTDLHGFAMPLIRYDVGDYAVAGEPCPCGRGLPVLKQVLGRVRNLFKLPDGGRYWPALGVRGLPEIAPILQHQFVQTAIDEIEARLVTAAPFSAAQEAAIRERVATRLPPGTRIRFAYLERIPRSASGKFEDFVSLV